MDRSSTSSEISFHGLPSKSKRPSIRKQIASSLSSQLIVLLFLRNSHLQRDIWRSLILVKLHAFTEAATEDVLFEKVLLERCSQNLQENTCQRLYFNKAAGLRL